MIKCSLEVMEGDKNCKCYKPGPTFSFLSSLSLITLQAFFILPFLKSVVMLLPWDLSTNSSFCLRQAVLMPITYPDIHFSPAQYLFILGTQFLITFFKKVSPSPSSFALLQSLTTLNQTAQETA